MRRARWTQLHVRRLFWRAGFGATPAEAAYWSRRGMAATLRFVLDGRGPAPRLPAPRVDGAPLDPVNEWGHDVLWWLDRMVRSPRPLVERMTLFWHDHFATTDQDTPLMLRQNELFRRHALGSFPRLLYGVMRDPAMQLFLSLANSDKEAPNENFARELMELFTLGAGYSERDIREASRALTGFVSDWDDSGLVSLGFDRERHDGGYKVIFGQRGRWGATDVLRLCLRHRRHPHFLVEKLWDHFVTTPIDPATRRSLVVTYLRSRRAVKPVIAEILRHPALYRSLTAPDMVKSPVVYVAGALRTTGTPITTDGPQWMLREMGQQPFDPPSVAGWDWGAAWMSSNAMRARFGFANHLRTVNPRIDVPEQSGDASLSPREALRLAHEATGRPFVSTHTRNVLLAMALRFFDDIPDEGERWQQRERARRAARLQGALRHLLLCGPDAQLM